MKIQLYQFESLHRRLKGMYDEVHRLQSTLRNFDLENYSLNKSLKLLRDAVEESNEQGNDIAEKEKKERFERDDKRRKVK